jgi:hypothetical protein
MIAESLKIKAEATNEAKASSKAIMDAANLEIKKMNLDMRGEIAQMRDATARRGQDIHISLGGANLNERIRNDNLLHEDRQANLTYRQQKLLGDKKSEFTPEGLKSIAQEYLEKGSGVLNRLNDSSRKIVINEAAKIEAEEGGTPKQRLGKQATFHADTKALDQLTKDYNILKPFDEMLDTNAAIAIDLGRKIVKTNNKYANETINSLTKNFSDAPGVSDYLFQVNTLQTEAARVLHNPRLVGQLSDNARMDMQKVFDGSMPIKESEAVINRMILDGHNRTKSMENQIGRIEDKLSAWDGRKTGDNSKEAGSKSDTLKIGDVVDGYKWKGGPKGNPSSWEKQ